MMIIERLKRGEGIIMKKRGRYVGRVRVKDCKVQCPGRGKGERRRK